MIKRIGIIGMGHVGRVMYELFNSHVDVVEFDLKDGVSYPQRELAACDIALVCVDTPSLDNGAPDTSNVWDAVERVPVELVLLKSTIPPGTTERLIKATGKRICFWPEYVGESDYFQPYWPGGEKDMPFVILGGEATVRQRVIDFLLPILGPIRTYFQCSALDAEIIKYMENSYLATKVVFVNEFRRICEAFGADWHTVREGWLLDPRIEPSHTAAFAESPGFKGKCLPKDLSAIIHAAAESGYEAALLAEVLRSNERLRNRGTAGEQPR